MSLLGLAGVAAGYGEVDIVRGIDLAVEAGEIVTIAGTNGAGKSTLVKAIMGLAPKVSGRIAFDGADLLRLDAEARIDIGISYVPQVANVFAALTVVENLQVVERVADRRARIAEMLALFPALAARRRTVAGALSGGERQQLAFARALMPRPKMMLLDEPTAALSPALVAQVFGLIKGLPALGVAALVVEQRARQSLEISDRGYILDSGAIVLHGDAAALLADERMAELYLGGAP
ncbi:MAG TPA: ABC transporter ATP-binding protein [Alphaproteobacteria bacterium]|nr:ABC transporter ATP-binding protein [Alphaproteobacteria bacterium]